MRHGILGIIVLCMVSVANTVSAQEIDEQELQHQLLADIDITEAEIMQFGINLAGVDESYQQVFEEYQERFHLATRENYKEYVESAFDLIISPLMSDIRTEAVHFFTEDQYAKLTLRLYQVAEIFPESFQSNEIPVGDFAQLFLLPEVVPMTEVQLSGLVAMQKEVLTEIVGIDLIMREEHAELFDEQKALFEKMEKAETEEEKTEIRNKIREVMQKTSALMREPVQKTFETMKTKLDTLLTVEQKAKLAQIKQDTPEYLKKALAGLMKTESDEDEPAAWRPGVNSWVPGMGVPTDRTGYQNEAPRVREPRGERRFPTE